jgi:hypothetical protein
MSDDADATLTRRVAEIIQNDSMLIETTAVEIARALNMEGNNRTLGRKFVRLALASESVDVFKEKTIEYGQIRREILLEIHHRVHQKYSNTLIQQRECSDGVVDGSLFGFSGKTEKLDMQNEKKSSKGGILNRNGSGIVFQKPESLERVSKSTLGLDTLSRKKREAAFAISVDEDEGTSNDASLLLGGQVCRL